MKEEVNIPATVTNVTFAQRTLDGLIKLGRDPKKYRVLVIAKHFSSYDELFNSPEYNDLWAGYQGKSRDILVWRKYFKFITAFTVATEPEKNYGRSNSIYLHYECENGQRMLKELSVISSLDNNALRPVIVYDDSVLYTDSYYKKTDEARRWLAHHGVTVS